MDKRGDFSFVKLAEFILVLIVLITAIIIFLRFIGKSSSNLDEVQKTATPSDAAQSGISELLNPTQEKKPSSTTNLPALEPSFVFLPS